MLKILCCCKWVIDEAYIRSDSAGNLDLGDAPFRLNESDRHALEEAVRIKSDADAEVTVVTLAVPDHGKAVKDALSRGADQAIFISSEEFQGLDYAQTAAIIAEVIHQEAPDFDLILCGEASSDFYASQTGARLARRLEIPSTNAVSQLSVDAGHIIARRKYPLGIETVSVPMPCLVAVSPDINVPRIPGLKDTLSAGKKPMQQIDDLDFPWRQAARQRQINVRAVSMERQVEMLASDDQGIAKLAQILDSAARKRG